MKRLVFIPAITVFLVLSCSKPDLPNTGSNRSYGDKNLPPIQNDESLPPPSTPPAGGSNAILVDASRDGGVWWFPQYEATGFSATAHHQGKALANYLKSLGYKVDELPRGITISGDLLGRYKYVIRAGGFGTYSTGEIDAYTSFLQKDSSSLLLIQDHLSIGANDPLSISLGVMFEGTAQGTISYFAQHPVTAGVHSIPFIAGSVVSNPDPQKITLLGSLNPSAGEEGLTSGVMGIVHHSRSKIFFLGDMNGLESVPQPFTQNLVKWLFP